MSKAKVVKDYKPISDRQLELMNDSQLITTRNVLKSDLHSGKSDPDGFIMTDYNRLCGRMAERLERYYALGLIPGPVEMSYISELKSELAACQQKLEVLKVENRRLFFELTGVEPDLELPSESDSEPVLPFYYPDGDDSDSCCDSVLIV